MSVQATVGMYVSLMCSRTGTHAPPPAEGAIVPLLNRCCALAHCLPCATPVLLSHATDIDMRLWNTGYPHCSLNQAPLMPALGCERCGPSAHAGVLLEMDVSKSMASNTGRLCTEKAN